MHEMALIDNSYNMMEFESLRGQYQCALYRLVMIARSATGNENILPVPRYHSTLYSKAFYSSWTSKEVPPIIKHMILCKYNQFYINIIYSLLYAVAYHQNFLVIFLNFKK